MKYLKNTQGMTLIEVLVAIALFAIAAVPLLGVFHQSVITNADSKIRTQEATIAQSIAEDIKAQQLTGDALANFISQLIENKNKELLNKGLIINKLNTNDDTIGNLRKYIIQVSKINSNINYTLTFLGPMTNINWTVPNIDFNNVPPIDYDKITDLAKIVWWGFLFAVFVAVWKIGLLDAFKIIFSTIFYDWFNGLKDLYSIAEDTIVKIKAEKGIELKIPKALQFWDPNYEWWWFFIPWNW
ncbi:prepilin-type N-terminal cleavage/methylation domain-containing protein [Thermoanaerobacterium sp. RBIITD]|uniref:prepilin-type N-terminal cleavage/methylation domain-containing protein n=1 Tax=Thermoanaerobacterium sp. RBIITD TaxID=1550240 RepID=UPI000BB7C7FB|nr:prepilin-type N-terminal cleavage/methylation domain-containing protein [Thermoanaerobacterium sp. RBIITD]SNX55344.1 prepilin-type N-terminal cleavage/methylation domain-containing protein [Thermoanaerobacterium sp. RBIITD]